MSLQITNTTNTAAVITDSASGKSMTIRSTGVVETVTEVFPLNQSGVHYKLKRGTSYTCTFARISFKASAAVSGQNITINFFPEYKGNTATNCSFGSTTSETGFKLCVCGVPMTISAMTCSLMKSNTNATAENTNFLAGNALLTGYTQSSNAPTVIQNAFNIWGSTMTGADKVVLSTKPADTTKTMVLSLTTSTANRYYIELSGTFTYA